jgi:hypothetical protein
MREAIAPYLKGFVGALVGGALLLLVAHLYQDHVIIHDIVRAIQQSNQRAAQPPAPTPPATPTP